MAAKQEENGNSEMGTMGEGWKANKTDAGGRIGQKRSADRWDTKARRRFWWVCQEHKSNTARALVLVQAPASGIYPG